MSKKETAQEKVDRILTLLYSERKAAIKEMKLYAKEHDYVNALKSKEYSSNCGFLIQQIESDGEL